VVAEVSQSANGSLHIKLHDKPAALEKLGRTFGMFKDRIEHIGKDGEPLKMRSDLEIGRRLAFVLELIARGEVKAKMPKGAPLLDGIEVPERDLAGREFATSQIASHCGSSKVDENREPQAKTEPAVGSEPASLVPSGRPPQ